MVCFVKISWCHWRFKHYLGYIYPYSSELIQNHGWILISLSQRKAHDCRQPVKQYWQIWIDDHTNIFITNITTTKQSTTKLASIASFHWHHNEDDGVSNHQPLDCLLNRLFSRRSKKTSKLRVIGPCVGNSPVTGEFLAQRASNAENASI